MAIQVINTGTSPNSGNGDSIRTAFSKVNANFAELATLATGTSFDLLAVPSSIIPATDQAHSLGSASEQWENLYLGPNGVTIDGNELTIDGSGNITVNGTPFQSGFASTSSLINGDVQVDLDATGSLNFPPNGIIQSYISSATTATIILIDDIMLDSPVMIHTVDPHGLSDSDLVKISGIGTTIELNNKYHYVSVINTTTVDLYEDYALSIPVNGTSYTPYLGLSNAETFTNTGTTGRSNIISQFLDVYPDMTNVRINWYVSGPGIDQPDADNTTYTVVKQPGFLNYLVDGEVNKPLYLQRGNTYYLDVFAPPHPVYIQTTGGVYSPADVYSLGVTNNGTGEGIITFTVPLSAPDTLYYQCQHHAGMGGPIYISDGVGTSRVLAINTQTTSSRVLYQFTIDNTYPLVNEGSYAFTGTFAGGGQLEFQDVQARLTVRSNEQEWIFNPNGVLIIPPNGDIERNGLSVLSTLIGKTFVVTQTEDGEKYVFDGVPDSPDLVLIRGLTYYFEVNMPAHPFWIQSVPGAFNVELVYRSGVINNGVEVGTLTFTVPEDAPDTLYYACEYHPGMTGQFLIRNLGNEIDPTKVHSNIVPETQYTYDLGTTSTHWRNLYARTGFFGNLPTWTVVNPLSVFTSDVNGYTQLQTQNQSTGTSASTDFVATADSGDDETDYIDLGINGSNYSNEDWTISGGRDGYLYVAGNNLTIGTDSSGTTVKIHVGGTLEENIVATFDAAGTASTSTTTGALTVAGGVGVAGDIVSYNLIPAADLTYDLGSTTTQWRSLYVGTSTIYLGGTALSVSGGNITVDGSPVDGLPNATIPESTGTTYKGLQVSYGMIHSNGSSNELNVNKIVIHKPAITTTTIDPTSSQDDFAVTGLGDSDVLAMFVLYGDVNGPKALSTLTTFAEAAINNVILDSGVAGDYNTVEEMKTAFYTNYATLAAAAGGLDQDFTFFIGNVPTTTGTTTVLEGSGAVFDITNLGNGTYYASGIQNNGINYRAGHKIKILGTSLTGAVNTTTYIAGTDYAPLDVIRGSDAISVSTTQTAIIAALSTGTVLTNIDGLGETLTITGSGVEYIEYTGFLIYPTTGTVTVSIGTGLNQFTLDGFTYPGVTPDNDCIVTVDSISEGGLIFQWSVTGTAAGTEEVFHGAITGTNYQTGSGFSVGNINPNNFAVSVTNPGSNYVAGDQVTLPGSDLQNGTSPDNDIVITILTVDGGGGALTWEYTSGTVPPGTWPANDISDGGNDQYDGANYINSSLANQIAYNGGNTVADGTTEFGTGSSYTFVYNTGIFGLLVTGNQSTLIRTSGNSGADGSSTTEAGNLYGPNTASQSFDNALTHINLIGDPYAGAIVSFTHSDNGNEIDILIPDDGLGAGVGITRDNNNGIYNPYREGEWDSDVSPGGTLWNIDGWEDFSDVESRTYTPLYEAFGFGGLGNKIVGTECVMYLPDNGKYYAVKFSAWTQNNNGGGFAYTRRELDLTSLSEGIRFADGTRLKSAEGLGRIKLESPGARRIEEAHGYKSVSVTEVVTTNLTTVASRAGTGTQLIWIDSTATTIDNIIDTPANFGNAYGFEFSLDNSTWYTWTGGSSGSGVERGYTVSPSLTYLQGDTVYFRYKTGGQPVVWWDKNELPGGGGNFRGAVIDYHAYTSDGTTIGTIHIVDDDGEENITHTEVSSGGEDLENDDLWFVLNEGTISYRRIDGAGRTLKVQWTAKVFYGSEIYD